MPTDNPTDDSDEEFSQADVHRTSVREDQTVTMSIIEELSGLHDCAPIELEPIHYDVDPEKLDWIVDGADENKVSFVSNDFVVVVYGNGTMVFTPAED